MTIHRSFVRIDARWTVEEALDVLSAGKPTHAIVHRIDRDGREYFYAYPTRDLVQRLQGRRGATVFQALDLHEYTATPTIALGGAPKLGAAVVLDRDRIIGIAEPADALGVRNPSDPGKPNGDGPPDGTRGLVATGPDKLAVGSTASIVVKLTAVPGDGAVAIPATAGAKIDIVVQASGAVSMAGTAEGTFEITGANDLMLQFKVHGDREGDGRVSVYAFDRGRGVGEVIVPIKVLASVTSPREEQRAGTIHGAEDPPDLSVIILEDKRARTYRLLLDATDSTLGLNHAGFGPIALDDGVDAFFTTFYADIEAILASDDNPRAKYASLEQKGSYLFSKVMPAELQDRLWKLRGRIKSVLIQSEEPWVPWELCRLCGKDDTGMIVEGGFISQEFEVTRWFLGVPQYRTLSLRSIGLVVPADSGLRAADGEQAAIQALATPTRTVTEIPARTIDLRTALGDAVHDGLHFVGHGLYGGTNADRSAIKLEDGRKFMPEDLAGRVANLGRRHPIVFLNACEVGRAGTALGGMAGWPQAFIKAGAGAFIGPFWKIGDGTGSRFAALFYERMLTHDTTVGQAVHHARMEIRKASDPTWLAYIAYAHPDARVEP